MMVSTMTTIPANIPLCALLQSIEKWYAFLCGCVAFLNELFRALLISGMDLTFFHISNRMTAQISEYSIVHGNKNGLEFWTKDPIIFVLWHSWYFCVTWTDLLTISWTTSVALWVEWVELWWSDNSAKCASEWWPSLPWLSCDKCQISCFVSSIKVYSHSHKFVATCK